MKSRIERVQGEVHPGQALDITAIIGIITAIMEAIRGCGSAEAARSHIRRGSAIAVLSARKALKASGYQGNALAFAYKLAQQGPSLTEAELDAVMSETRDIPEPPPVEGGGWPTWPDLRGLGAILAVCALMFAGSAVEASWPVVPDEPAWPVSIESPKVESPRVEIPKVKTPPAETPRVEVRKPPVMVTPAPAPSAGKPLIPAARRWEFAGDTGPDSLRRHLMDPNHRGPIMRWLGVSSVAEYEAELRKLNYSELKQLHSADHEHLTQGRAARSATVHNVSHQPATYATDFPTVAPGAVVQAPRGQVHQSAPQAAPVVSRGVFGRVRTYRPMRMGCPSGGCP